MRLPRTLTQCSGTGELVTFAAADTTLTTDRVARTIEGLIVPFGPAGFTAAGLLTFRSGSLTWARDPKRVKLLVEHDQNRPVGHALSLEERPEGLWGTFRVKPGAEGDAVLDDLDEGVRDGFSIGVQLDGASEDRLRRARPGQAVAGAGQVRETSTVSVPAFDDARAARTPGELVAAATGPLVTMTTPTPTPGPGQDPTPSAGASTPPAEDTPATTPAPAHPTPAPGTSPITPATAQLTGAAGPAPVRAAAGAAGLLVGAEAATYTFDGRGPSLVRDAWAARALGDQEAAGRMARLNAELVGGNLNSVHALIAASAGEDIAGRLGRLATAAPGDPIPSPALSDDAGIAAGFLPPRFDAMRQAIDAGRPLVSRLPRTVLSSAQPFTIPREGEFSGVDYHTEGTAHVAAGTLSLGDAVAVPQALSGYYEISRELVDASNPALDRIALRAMLRDYRRKSEQHAVDAVEAIAPTEASVDSLMALRTVAEGFVDDDGFGADFIAASKGVLTALYADTDTTGRPMISAAGNAPTAGTGRAGYTGAGVDGTEIVRVPRLTTPTGYLIRSEGVLFGESAVQQFRFEEIKGPGIIALALWAYVVAAVLDTDDILGFSTDVII